VHAAEPRVRGLACGWRDQLVEEVELTRLSVKIKREDAVPSCNVFN
jgi:hypothetical protein